MVLVRDMPAVGRGFIERLEPPDIKNFTGLSHHQKKVEKLPSFQLQPFLNVVIDPFPG